jgi:hypothetical protein
MEIFSEKQSGRRYQADARQAPPAYVLLKSD